MLTINVAYTSSNNNNSINVHYFFFNAIDKGSMACTLTLGGVAGEDTSPPGSLEVATLEPESGGKGGRVE